MSTSYVGSPVLSTSITIPVDGDLANANSVNVSAKALADNDYYLMRSLGQIPESTAPIRITSLSPFVGQVTVEPIPFAVVTENGVYKTLSTNAPVTLGSAAIEGGGNFLPNTIYFIYMYSVAGVANWQLSTTPPDTNRLYKQGGTTHKYIASVPTDGNTPGVPYSLARSRGNTAFIQDVSPQTVNNTTETPLSIVSLIVPRFATKVALYCRVSAPVMVSAFGYIVTIPGSTGMPLFAKAGSTTNFYLEVPTNPATTGALLSGRVSSAGTIMDVRVRGYME